MFKDDNFMYATGTPTKQLKEQILNQVSLHLFFTQQWNLADYGHYVCGGWIGTLINIMQLLSFQSLKTMCGNCYRTINANEECLACRQDEVNRISLCCVPRTYFPRYVFGVTKTYLNQKRNSTHEWSQSIKKKSYKQTMQ